MTDHTAPAASAPSGVVAPHGVCVFCQDPVYQLDDDSPAHQDGPSGNWATLATGTSCPFRDNAGHAVYTEDEPCVPVTGVDLGGRAQVGESWCRGFSRPLPDGLTAVIVIYFYVQDQDIQPIPGQAAGSTGRVLVVATEHAVCRMADDGGLDEDFNAFTYLAFPEQPATEDAARRACELLDVASFTWDGDHSGRLR